MTDLVLSRTIDRALSSGYAQPQVSDGRTDLDLAVGEARYRLPDPVRAEIGAAVAGLDRPWYGDPTGSAGLRAAFLHRLLEVPAGDHAEGPNRRAGDMDAGELIDRVLVTAGGKEAAMLAVRYQLHRRGHGRVLLPQPGWEPYGIWAHAHDVRVLPYDPVALAADPKLLYDIAARDGYRPATLVLNYPHNPTGVTLDQGRMDALIAAAVDLGLAVVSDEVYRWFGPQPVSAVHAPAYDPALHLVVDSTSKWLTTAGLRVGFLVADEGIVRSLTAFRATYASCTSIVDQRIAELLITSATACAWLAEVRAEVDVTRRATVQHLTDAGVPVLSDGALYIWCGPPQPGRASGPGGSARARVTAGATFGAPDHIRLCTARAGLDPAAAAAAVCTTLRSGHA
ncbi:pyridoxal phosphate-dependent aminotransferase [Dactylosporangium sp. NPDC051485]|uniref:pyridoxal phosphate-dependent aminotransferase n=1 Tax=Dactylosporangium sp. NPDC051485 TaxID=3154846 RepID=UPI00343F04E9